MVSLNEALIDLQRLVDLQRLAFCPTGDGGGVDPHCSPKNKGKEKLDFSTMSDYDLAKNAGEFHDRIRQHVKNLVVDAMRFGRPTNAQEIIDQVKRLDKGITVGQVHGAIRELVDKGNLVATPFVDPMYKLGSNALVVASKSTGYPIIVDTFVLEKDLPISKLSKSSKDAIAHTVRQSEKVSERLKQTTAKSVLDFLGESSKSVDDVYFAVKSNGVSQDLFVDALRDLWAQRKVELRPYTDAMNRLQNPETKFFVNQELIDRIALYRET